MFCCLFEILVCKTNDEFCLYEKNDCSIIACVLCGGKNSDRRRGRSWSAESSFWAVASVGSDSKLVSFTSRSPYPRSPLHDTFVRVQGERIGAEIGRSRCYLLVKNVGQYQATPTKRITIGQILSPLPWKPLFHTPSLNLLPTSFVLV